MFAAKITPGNVDDRAPVPELCKTMKGKLFGDKGVEMVTNVRKNMKAKVYSLWDSAMLSRRFIIETIHDPLKNISQLEHTRHRSVHGFKLNLIGGLIADCMKENKSALNLSREDFDCLKQALTPVT